MVMSLREIFDSSLSIEMKDVASMHREREREKSKESFDSPSESEISFFSNPSFETLPHSSSRTKIRSNSGIVKAMIRDQRVSKNTTDRYPLFFDL